MITELHNYDIFPKVLIVREPVTITIRPLGKHVAFTGTYTVAVLSVVHGLPQIYTQRNNICEYESTVDADGCIRISHLFPEESEYIIRICKDQKILASLSVYALEEDMRGRYPYRGDLHMHSFRSDGWDGPAIVAANYRKYGYDFMAITDHYRYYPSLEAIEDYEGVHHELNLVYGEEVHLPDNDIHIVNFGGTYSVNGLIDCSPQNQESGKRAVIDNPPPVLTLEQYKEEVNKLIEELNIPEGIEKFTYASCVWAFNHIRNGGGLGIFAHPFWMHGPGKLNPFQVPESFYDYMVANKPFDAYEVLGGDNTLCMTRLQPVKYYDDRAKGIHYPIVGSTDSHGSASRKHPLTLFCSTFVFARENERTALISAIKDEYSVAVDTASSEYRLIGDYRLVKYTRFLLDHFTPLHDDLCFEEGRLMKEYAVGNESAGRDLQNLYGRMKKLYEKYFAVG